MKWFVPLKAWTSVLRSEWK